MKILICIDDTDNMESIGTGELLQMMGTNLRKKGLGDPGFISRHQLFVHEDIPYTSHNSSMCFEMEIDPADYDAVREFAIAFLEENAAEGSDPGLCIIKKDLLTEAMVDTLIAYGKAAKDTILQKEDAYGIAGEMAGTVHLSEHGGTGGGVIGCLAGAGLRLSGSDGKMKGKIYPENEGIFMTVETILSGYPFDEVREFNGGILEAQTKIRLGETLKAVLKEHKLVLLVKPLEDHAVTGAYRTCENKELKCF